MESYLGRALGTDMFALRRRLLFPFNISCNLIAAEGIGWYTGIGGFGEMR